MTNLYTTFHSSTHYGNLLVMKRKKILILVVMYDKEITYNSFNRFLKSKFMRSVRLARDELQFERYSGSSCSVKTFLECFET